MSKINYDLICYEYLIKCKVYPDSFENFYMILPNVKCHIMNNSNPLVSIDDISSTNPFVSLDVLIEYGRTTKRTAFSVSNIIPMQLYWP